MQNVNELFVHLRRRELWIGVALAGLTVLAFAPVCTSAYAFINYDDPVYVSHNPQVQLGLSFQGVLWALTSFEHSNWHPLTWISLQMDYQLYGLRPEWFHRTNLLLHVANVLLLFWLLRGMTGAVWRSGVTAGLFAVHPLHVESVAWIAERKDVLSTFFWLLTLWAYGRYAASPSVLRYLLVVLCLTLGLTAKPMLVTLPCVLCLLDYWPLRRFPPCQDCRSLQDFGSLKHNPPASTSRFVWEKLPLFILVFVSCQLTLIAQQPSLNPLSEVSLDARLRNAAVVYVIYLRKMFWPSDLAVFYPYSIESASAGQTTAAILLLAGITILAVWHVKTRPYLLVGWFWYLGTLVPVIGLVKVGDQAMADRYTYVPLIGIFVMATWGAADLLSLLRRPWRIAVPLAGMVLTACLLLTVKQVGYWRDSLTLWQHCVAVNENNAFAQTALGDCLLAEGRSTEASNCFRKAIAIKPKEAIHHFRLAVALRSQGKQEEADQEDEKGKALAIEAARSQGSG